MQEQKQTSMKLRDNIIKHKPNNSEKHHHTYQKIAPIHIFQQHQYISNRGI